MARLIRYLPDAGTAPTDSSTQQKDGSDVQLCFLSLPLEIRLSIYEYAFELSTSQQLQVLVSEDTIATSEAGYLVLHCTKQPKHHLSLTIFQCSKQTYREALPALYLHFAFFPIADRDVITSFFGRMSAFARSSITKLQLRPRPQKIIRRTGPSATSSKTFRGPSWMSACDILSVLFINLKELLIHLHPMYGYELGKGEELGWIIRPLTRLHGVKKTLASIGHGSEKTLKLELVTTWDELVEKADHEAEDYAMAKNKIMEDTTSWSNPYWILKRNNTFRSEGLIYMLKRKIE